MTRSPADTTRLIRYGLDPTALPAKIDEYRELVARCLADSSFREQTEQTAAALDLYVVAVDATVGIVVVPDSGSVFAPSWSWLRDQIKVEPSAANRMILGILLVGVAALCYPTAASLSDPALRRFTAPDVDRLLRRHGEMLAEGSTVLENGMKTAWGTYASRKAVDRAPSGQLKRSCTVALAERICDLLATQRLLLRTEEGGQVVYRSTDRFRYLVSRRGATLAYRALIDLDASDVALLACEEVVAAAESS